MANVEYRNVGKKYGAVEVLKGLDLDIVDGEFVVLLGASGCGKTTLLRMTAGLETITAGTVKIDDKVVNDVPPRDRNIAMVFQNYALYPTMKVRDNIGFSLEVAKHSKEEISKRVEEAAKVLNLTEYLDRKPAELSGGQRQRVAMGRAMVRDAKVFLFDEPLSNLDAKLRAHMRVEIRQLHDRLGATTIYVTHDQIEAMTMADKIVLMEGGRIVQMGSPDDLYDRPNSLYVAEFIGTPAINKLHGQLEVEAGNPVLKSQNAVLPLKKGLEKYKGKKIVLGVRPNDVRVDKAGPIEGVLELPETTGADVHLHTKVGEDEFIVVVPRHTKFKIGEKIRFSAKPEQLHVFDASNGERLEA